MTHSLSTGATLHKQVFLHCVYAFNGNIELYICTHDRDFGSHLQASEVALPLRTTTMSLQK